MVSFWTVTVRKSAPAWDEVDGIVYEHVAAASKSEAVKQVRRRAANDGHVGYGCGRATFTATEGEAPEPGDWGADD